VSAWCGLQASARIRTAGLTSVGLAAGLVTCATSMTPQASQKGSQKQTSGQSGLQVRLPLLRMDLLAVMKSLNENEIALKAVIADANWEWMFRDVFMVLLCDRTGRGVGDCGWL
jgi:hypothetical protein